MALFLPNSWQAIAFMLLCIQTANGLSNSTVNCGQTSFTSDTGTISFSSQSSSLDKRCTYEIKTRKDSRIVLKWRNFVVDAEMPYCKMSSVSVYLGCSSTKLIDFCSKNTASLPHDIYTRDNCLKLVFNSKSKSLKEEFSATYFTADEDKPISSTKFCVWKRKLYAKSGIISSPGWPTGYGALIDDCEKSLLTSEKKKNYYCGKFNPFSRITRYYELEFEFDTKGYRRRNRGFIVGYIAYKTPDSVSASKKMTKMAYIGIAVAILILIGCIGFYAFRRRRARSAYQQAQQQQPSDTGLMKTTTTNYNDGNTVSYNAAPPPYSAAVSQPDPGYQGYQNQPYPGTTYPTQQTGAPYPPSTAPPFYPPASTAPYPPPGIPPASGMTSYTAANTPYPEEKQARPY